MTLFPVDLEAADVEGPASCIVCSLMMLTAGKMRLLLLFEACCMLRLLSNKLAVAASTAAATFRGDTIIWGRVDCEPCSAIFSNQFRVLYKIHKFYDMIK